MEYVGVLIVFLIFSFPLFLNLLGSIKRKKKNLDSKQIKKFKKRFWGAIIWECFVITGSILAIINMYNQ